MKLNFCPECAERMTPLNKTRYMCPNGHIFYNNPHAACCVIFTNDVHELLYAKRARAPKQGKYDFPGGFLNYEESPYPAAVREVREEMGVTVDPHNLQLLDASRIEYDENDAVVDFVFLCHAWEGTMRAADDVAELIWKPLAFMQSDEFAWPYPYLYNKLHAILNPL
jgi:8-oxo-dGTP diphosphatase